MWFLSRRRRRERLLRQPLSAHDRDTLAAAVPCYRRLSASQRNDFEERVKILFHERHWEGCDGLTVSDTMRLHVAGHAALMLLGTQNWYFDSVSAILIFPDIIERYENGVVTQVVGEAWEGGSVVLSWSDVRHIARARDGRNVVVHEFAHHLDGIDGEMAGSIHFPARDHRERWEEVASAEFARLVRQVEQGRPTFLDPYGATNRAEFFAVASEAFFERSLAMYQHHAELFELLNLFYNLDPREWSSANFP